MTEFRLDLSAHQQQIVILAKDVQGNYTKSLQFCIYMSEIQSGKFPMYKWEILVWILVP